jgi:site-specific recombinase XerD
MLKAYFRRECTRTRYYTGAAGPYLDAFVQWFEEEGYQGQTIRRRVRGAVQFAAWAGASGRAVAQLDASILSAFGRYLARRSQLRDKHGAYTVRFLGARYFLSFLQSRGIVPITADASPRPLRPALLDDFRDWMVTQRGVSESTLNSYQAILLDLLERLGEQVAHYTAKRLRGFVLDRVRHRNAASAQNVVAAVRMWLRFLIANGRCEPGLDEAIPTIAAWRLSALPRYLPAEDVERVISACDTATPLGARDQAVILLLARLGLRASEVADLRLVDLDWQNGTLDVQGKYRRKARLPLPQDVGDSLLHYLEQTRPSVNSDKVFISTVAPLRPLSRATITQTAARALRRAGIDAPFFGAHLFRHSAATTLLRQGASLQTIGEVLRHASLETTVIYAKVDHGLLQQVALPWPEEVTLC